MGYGMVSGRLGYSKYSGFQAGLGQVVPVATRTGWQYPTVEYAKTKRWCLRSEMPDWAQGRGTSEPSRKAVPWVHRDLDVSQSCHSEPKCRVWCLGDSDISS